MEWLVILAVIVYLVGVVLPRSRRKSARTAADQLNGEPTDAGWEGPNQPYRRKSYFFTKSEAAFYHSVRQLLPPDHHVFPKVRLSDLVEIDANGKDYWSAYGRLSQKHLDFVLCDQSFRPYLAVEIDGSSHNSSRQQRSDDTKNSILDVTGLPLLRYQVGTNWDVSAIKQYLP